MTGAVRSASLRTRVAAASAAGALMVLVVSSGLLSVVLTRQQYAGLDRDVVGLAEAMTPLLARDARRATADRPVPVGGLGARLADGAGAVLGSPYAVVARRRGIVVADRSSPGAPALPAGSGSGLATVATDAGDYRTLTTPGGLRGGLQVTAGLPTAEVEARTAAIRRSVAVVGGLAVLAAAGLGVLLSGPAVRPLRLLRDRARSAGAAGAAFGDVRGAREVEELATALDRMQADIAAARAREATGLAVARDFAAAAGHELRTPLASLTTDLAVLTAHPDVGADDRVALLASLRRAADRIRATLDGLGRLARADLADPTAAEVVDLADLLPLVTTEWRNAHPGLPVELHLPAGTVEVRGWSEGLRLVVTNLLANVPVHGGHRAVVAASPGDGPAREVLVTVDDDGPGVPQHERGNVLGRFVRGSSTAPPGPARSPGSGLGLALVAQQVSLHGGRLTLTDSALGGLRVEIRLPAA